MPRLVIVDKSQKGFARYCPAFAKGFRSMAEGLQKYRMKRKVRRLFSKERKDEIVKIGSPAIPALKELLKAKKWNDRSAAVDILGKMDDTLARLLVIQTADDENDIVSSNAGHVIWSMDNVSALPVLINALDNNNVHVRCNAARALGRIGDGRAIDPLIGLLQDDYQSVRETAVRSLGETGDISAVPALINAMKNDEENVGYSAESALKMVGSPAIPLLIDGLKDGKASNRIVDILVDIGEDSLPALREAMKSSRMEKRKAAVIAVGRFKKFQDVFGLVMALKDPYSDIRYEAAWALGEIGHVSAVSSLIESLNDRDGAVRWRAAQALAKTEEKNPGSVDLEKVKEKLREFAAGSKRQRQAAGYYNDIAEAVAKGREKFEVQDVPDKPEHPKGIIFREGN